MSPDQLTMPVAEDHSLYRPGIDNAACRAGWLEVVAEAETGIGAMTAAHTNQPDVVLTDLNMPGLDRIEPFPARPARRPHLVRNRPRPATRRSGKVFGFITSSQIPALKVRHKCR